MIFPKWIKMNFNYLCEPVREAGYRTTSRTHSRSEGPFSMRANLDNLTRPSRFGSWRRSSAFHDGHVFVSLGHCFETEFCQKFPCLHVLTFVVVDRIGTSATITNQITQPYYCDWHQGTFEKSFNFETLKTIL